MPYTIRKQKCKQSDGDSGSYVLSYTDKSGKKHRNCHTSRKKAQGQIAAIEGPREGDGPEGELVGEALLREMVQEMLNEGSQSVKLGAAYELLIQSNLNRAGIGVPGRKSAGSGHGADVKMTFKNVEVGIEAKTSAAADIGQANVLYDMTTETFSWSDPNETTSALDEFGVLDAINTPKVIKACNRFLKATKTDKFPARVSRELYDSYGQSLELATVPIDTSVIVRHYTGKGAESSSYIQFGKTKSGIQLVGKGKGLYIVDNDPLELSSLGVPQFEVPSVEARVRLKSGGGRPLTTISLNVALKVSTFPDSPINLENISDLKKIRDYLNSK